MSNVSPSRPVGPYGLFMLVLCIISLIVIFVQSAVLLDEDVAAILSAGDFVICAVFLFDFVRNLYLAESKWRYLYTWGWIDLLSSIPAIDALRWGRAGRILRIVRALRAIRSFRVLMSMLMQKRTEATALTTILLGMLIIFVGAILILQIESMVDNPNIDGAADALWWSFVTITTVGYGDLYPVSWVGRVIACFMMVAGVGLFSALAGLVASWLVGGKEKAVADEISELRLQIEALTRELRRSRETSTD